MFDYGGTIVRPEAETMRNIVESLGYRVDADQVRKARRTYDSNYETYVKLLPRGQRWNDELFVETRRSWLRGLGLPKADLERIVDVMRKKRRMREPFPDVSPALEKLDSMGLKIGLLSENFRSADELRRELDGMRLLEYFRVVVSSEETPFDKPNPRLFIEGARRLGLHPATVSYVGDSYELDIKGSRAAGMLPILINREGGSTGGHCIVVTSLSALPKCIGERRLASS